MATVDQEAELSKAGANVQSRLGSFLYWCRSYPLGAIGALIAPHAGYEYSGAIAARAYHCLPCGATAPQIVAILENNRRNLAKCLPVERLHHALKHRTRQERRSEPGYAWNKGNPGQTRS